MYIKQGPQHLSLAVKLIFEGKDAAFKKKVQRGMPRLKGKTRCREEGEKPAHRNFIYERGKEPWLL